MPDARLNGIGGSLAGESELLEAAENPLIVDAESFREAFPVSQLLTPLAQRGNQLRFLLPEVSLLAPPSRSPRRSTSLEAAALAIAIGVLANTSLKLAVALFFGSARFRTIVGGTLVLMIVTAAAALVVPLM